MRLPRDFWKSVILDDNEGHGSGFKDLKTWSGPESVSAGVSPPPSYTIFPVCSTDVFIAYSCAVCVVDRQHPPVSQQR